MQPSQLRVLTSLGFVVAALACEPPAQDSAPQAATAPASSEAASEAAVSDALGPEAPAAASPSALPVAQSGSASAAATASGASSTLLEPDKAKRALADYRAELKVLCGSDAPIAAWPGHSAPDRGMLCSSPARAGRALASGSFLQVGSDEVALDVASGLAGAEGERALIVMRRQAAGYRMVRPMAIGRGFDAKIRVATSSTDVLLVCVHHGNMGYYPSTCGFLGHGRFAGLANDTVDEAAARDEFEILSVATCGEGASVELGAASLDGPHLRVQLVLEHFVREPRANDVGYFCSRKRTTEKRTVAVEYRIEAGRAVRVSPALEAVDRIVNGE